MHTQHINLVGHDFYNKHVVRVGQEVEASLDYMVRILILYHIISISILKLRCKDLPMYLR